MVSYPAGQVIQKKVDLSEKSFRRYQARYFEDAIFKIHLINFFSINNQRIKVC